MSAGPNLEQFLNGDWKPGSDVGPADPHSEGSYRRGYHQAIAEVATILEHRVLSAADLERWVETQGMKWRKDDALNRKILPPPLV
ncbi:hypothetical protein [Amantichitinum ursilacus]|uniref:hypothetical protein n=1 Tax=Amantichitinum ursilacus TaxID=857265 RepID=UPI0009FB33EC|nr:hypothetical protein [Amantichitinum ursilacus]